MSAVVLREAAALMRERAEAAVADPWWSPESVGATFNHADAEHIASWHPPVALAVADQLDAMAAVVEEAEGSPLAIVAAGLAEKSVAVARAYLGRAS